MITRLQSVLPDRPDRDPVTALTLTEEQILDAAARLVAPLAVCWQALALPCAARDRAREEIAWLLREERKS